MEMNELTKDRIADKVLSAMKREALMNKEAGEIFGFSPTYLSCITSSRGYSHVPRKAWEVMHDWAQLAKPLVGYKSPLKAELEAAAVAAEVVDTTPVPAPVKAPEPEPKKKGRKSKEEKKALALQLRSKFEASKAKPGLKPSHEQTIIIPRKGKRVDPVQLDIRTGALVTFEVFDNEILIRIKK